MINLRVDSISRLITVNIKKNHPSGNTVIGSRLSPGHEADKGFSVKTEEHAKNACPGGNPEEEKMKCFMPVKKQIQDE